MRRKNLNFPPHYMVGHQLFFAPLPDFSSQIAHVSLVMIRYNLLAMIKRSLDYETIGGLFRDVYAGVKEITVIEKIWNIILEVVAVIAEVLEADSEHILRQVLEKEERLVALRNYAKTA